MKKIPLSGKKGEGLFAIVDDEDFEELSKYNWYLTSVGYAARGKWNKDKERSDVLLMHRQLMSFPTGKLVDHINMEKLDNRKCNLRIATKSENMRNSPKRSSNTSGYKGVVFVKHIKKWKAEITLNYKNTHIGVYQTREEAAKAYDAKAVELFGEYAQLNFPNDDRLREETL